MATLYKYEAANANGTLKKVITSKKEAEDFAQEKLYEYPTYTITPVGGSAGEDEEEIDDNDSEE